MLDGLGLRLGAEQFGFGTPRSLQSPGQGQHDCNKEQKGRCHQLIHCPHAGGELGIQPGERAPAVKFGCINIAGQLMQLGDEQGRRVCVCRTAVRLCQALEFGPRSTNPADQFLSRLWVVVLALCTVIFSIEQSLVGALHQLRAAIGFDHGKFDVPRSLVDQEAGLEQGSGTVDTVEIGAEKFLMQRIEARKADHQRQPADCGGRKSQ